MDETLESKTLLLVAGPSGAGKTVLINQYRKNVLAPEIAALLPPDGRRWPQIGANDCMKRGIKLEGILPRSWPEAGGVVHYDIAYVHRFADGPSGIARYEDDPGSELFRRAGRIVAVSILPPVESLRRQFLARHERQRASKKASHLFWRDHVRGPVERVLARLGGVSGRETRELYGDADWLTRCYTTWTAYIGGLVSVKPGSRHVLLVPGEDDKSQIFHFVTDG